MSKVHFRKMMSFDPDIRRSAFGGGTPTADCDASVPSAEHRLPQQHQMTSSLSPSTSTTPSTTTKATTAFSQRLHQSDMSLPDIKTFMEGIHHPATVDCYSWPPSNGSVRHLHSVSASSTASSSTMAAAADDDSHVGASTMFVDECGGGGDEDPAVVDPDLAYGLALLTAPEEMLDPFTEPWGLSRLFQGDIDVDDIDYVPSLNSTPEVEGRRKIESVCSKLSISSDPTKWSMADVHKWLRFTLQPFYGPSSSSSCSSSSSIRESDWQLNGAQLCQLSYAAISERLSRDDDSSCMAVAELEMWKQLGPLVAASSSGQCYVSSAGLVPISSYGSSSRSYNAYNIPSTVVDAAAVSNAFVNYTVLESAVAGLSHDPSTFHSSGNNIIINNNYIYNNNNNNNTTNDNCLLSHTSAQRRLVVQTPEPAAVAAAGRCITATNGASGWDCVGGGFLPSAGSVNGNDILLQQPAFIKTELLSVGARSPSDDASPTASNSRWLSFSTPADSDQTRSISTFKWNETTSPPPASHHQLTDYRGTSRGGGRGGNKRTICLWQFLRELLLNPQPHENWIRWIDRNRGIFKIEDSVRVAKLWGERKNRPQMNYDKLSRSIRQYYKKGIIQKTTNSKRLVYQFCPEYM
jgi:SAM pointed domain-containing ETS transcription factor